MSNLYCPSQKSHSREFVDHYQEIVWHSYRYVCDCCGYIAESFIERCPICRNEVRRHERRTFRSVSV